MARYVALLRGINLAANTRISMPDLRRLFTGLGHEDVQTYVQSGNVVFTSPSRQPTRLARDIERRIADDLGMNVSVLVRTGDELAKVRKANPFLDREKDPTKLHVTFLAEKPKPAQVDRLERPKGEPAEFSLVGREVYLLCPNGYGRTKLNNAYIEKRLGVAATTRNWKTVTNLCDLASG
jgi:uncharacterized protein (DUF1697 family)